MRPEDLSIRQREVLRAVEWSRSRAFLLYLELNTEQWTVENEWLGLYRREVLENLIQNIKKQPMKYWYNEYIVW